MSDVAVELPAPQTGLMAWLRYDRSREAGVEAAYDAYIRTCRPGVYAALAIPAAVLVALVVAMFVSILAGMHARAIAVTSAMIAAMIGSYATLFVPILRCPAETRRLLLFGCTDVRRTCVFALVGAFVITCLELAAIAALEALHVPVAKHPPNLFIGGILFGAILIAVVAPIAEEFLVQAWFQTRMRPLGGVWAAVVATVFFVVIHFPKNLYDLVRGGNLAFAAYLRATTRSLLACIVAHVCNNALIVFVVLVSMLLKHSAVHN